MSLPENRKTTFKLFVRKYLWIIVLAAVVFAGYQLGKDRALRDNVRDADVPREFSE